ncbi:hypothetical protein [Horticoccus sp. 23ND18S-11]|uniref:hypothetical protein n=1 Tax=Horticoccus sp. 23ND18S-11 TaxID=3391832 RepID=UPI0039C937BB
MKPPRCLALLVLCFTAALANAQPSFTGPAPVPTVIEDAAQRRAAFLTRRDEVIAWRAGRAQPGVPATFGLGEIAARLALRQDAAACSAQLIEVLKRPTGDMFWMFPVTCIAYLGRDQLTPAAQAALREAWRTYFPLRGDTENHWVMYYSTLYLMAQLWPDEPGERWFNGKSSAEITAESQAWLLHWMDLTTTIGQGEYDCTHYIGEYSIPMLYMATWAKDPAMRQRGRMMLDYVMADYAVETLNGITIGAHARTDDTTVLEKWNGLASFFGWLLLGNCPPPANHGGWGFFFAVVADHYELPEVIYRIGTDRAGAYTHRERKRTRHRWRNSDVRNAPVYKTSYLTKDYALGSDQGGLLQPIQQHSWDLTWAVPDPRGVHNTIFSMQPYHGSHELMMYFTEMPDYLPAAVTFQGKPSYIAEDKLLGGSPYEQIFQLDDALISLCDIPAGTNFEQVNGFFSKDLAVVEEDASGWIFAQGGRAFIAYRPLAPYTWRPLAAGDRRLYSPHRQNGTILQAASADEFKSWDAFKAAIRALPLAITLAPTPKVSFTNLRGQQLECAYGASPRVNGRVIDHAREWKLFAGPYLNAEVGSRTLTLTHGRLTRVLDFNTLTITDAVAP